jgi:transcriptional regulator with XRE-family HTH domain
MPLHQGEILKRLVDNQSKPNEEVASLSGIAISSLYNYYNMEEIPSRKLRTICTVLNVDYVKTFINPPKKEGTGILNDDGKNVENEMQMSQIIKLLKQQIEQQNEILKLLKKKK